MLLWSIQHQCTYEKMEQTGVLRADKNFIATDWFEDSYLWMAEQMKKRIGELNITSKLSSGNSTSSIAQHLYSTCGKCVFS